MSKLALVALVACASPRPADPPIALPADPAPAPAPRAARQLAAETALTTRSGAALRAPTSWWLTEGDVIRLEDPERTLRVWFVEDREQDLAKAIAAAWQRVAPGFALPLDGALDTPPPSGGWDAIANASYEATGDRVVFARAHRFGAITHVVLVDGTRASVSRRGPQLEDAIATLAPAGMTEESLVGRTSRGLDPARAKELDGFIATALARLEVPGAAVAVVHDGTVIYERAFGVRALGDKAPVTANTRFMIGSITKSMTTAMQAALVDAKLLDWSTPVVSILPSFALGDAELTRNLLVWHTTCACTGMPRSDLENIFEYGSISAEQRLAAMKTMKPTTRLGETFQYSNLMVTAGGYIAAHAFAPRATLGDAYDAAMRKTIFEPIGMAATTLDFAVALRGDHAMPHAAALDGVVRAVPIGMERNVIPIRPAGGVWSTVRDMERYVMMELGNGVVAGKRVVSEVNLRARRIRRVGAPSLGYGLGLGVGMVHGVPVIEHDGGAMGFGASMFMLPEQQIGIIVLTNVRNGSPTEHLPFNVVVKRRVLEALFDARPLAAIQLDYFATGKAAAVATTLARVELTTDARLAKVAGTYHNASLGTVTLAVAGDGLVFDVGEWKRLVRPLKTAGALTLVHVEPPFAGAPFTIDDPDGTPTFTLTYEQASYRFERR